MSRIGLIFLFVTLAAAQPSVSITPATANGPKSVQGPGIYVKHNGRLLDALAYAFETDVVHADAPRWLKKARFDFDVEGHGGDPHPQFREILKQTFSLVTHWEGRPVLNGSGRGPRFRPMSHTEKYLVVDLAVPLIQSP